MDIKKIEELVRILDENALTCIEIKEGVNSYCVKRENAFPVQNTASPQAAAEKPEPETGEKITSPLAGVFYSSPSPDGPAFVKAGDKIKKGEVLCIVEAMKLMNEITAEKDCVIAEICAENEALVEYGQTLFKIT